MQSIRVLYLFLVLFVHKRISCMVYLQPNSAIKTNPNSQIANGLKNIHQNYFNVSDNRKIVYSKRSFDFFKKMKNIFNFKKINEVKAIDTRAQTCVKNLKLEEKLENIEEKNWTCKIIKDKATNIPLICSCSHQYECTETKEYHFSSKYKNEIKLKNQLMKINRGADFQCEKMLKKKTLVDWICELEKNQQQEITNTDEEYFCKCLHRKMCTYDRYVDIF